MRTVEHSANPKVQNANRLSQFFEIVCLLGLVVTLYIFLLIDDELKRWLFASLAFMVSIVCFFLAIRQHARAINAHRTTWFDFSRQRLHTLEVLKTPEDVMRHLQPLEGSKIRDEGRLFAKLDALLGSERCAEIRATVFKYTKVD